MRNRRILSFYFFNASRKKQMVHNLKHATTISLMFIAESFAKDIKSWLATLLIVIQ